MKLMNYDTKTLIMNNLRTTEKESVSDGYTHRQYEILCNLIRQKNIEKKFFDFLLNELYRAMEGHILAQYTLKGIYEN